MSLEKRYLQQPENGKRLSQKQIQDAAEPNTITLMARTAAGKADHYFYLYTDDKGKQYTVSGFPQNPDSLTGTVPNVLWGGGNWGNIVSKAAKYDEKSPDAGNATKVAVYRSSKNNPQEVNRAWQYLRLGYSNIDRAKIPYLLTGPNSNSAAMTAGEFLDTKMNVTKYDSNNKVIDKAPVRTDILAPGDNLDDIIYGPRGSTNNTDSAASNTQTNNRGISTPDRSETIQGTSGTALTGTAGSSPTALTGIAGSSSTALTGTAGSSPTALTGTAGNTNTALTGGTSTTALTGGTSTTVLTGGETQQPIQLRQGMALS
jgi:hypothetical protein